MNKRHLLSFLLLPSLTLAVTGGRVLAQEAHISPGIVFKFDREPQKIAFSNGDVRLAGVLLEPEGKGPFPALILVHGAGPETHDGPAFVVHANAFLKQGFAVLAYDKRGSGGSTGDLGVSDYDDLAQDVGAAVNFLRTKTEIARTKIGLLGRSEGAWVSTIAASHDPLIAFVIMSSGSAVGPYDQTVYWTRRALRESGTPAERIDEAIRFKTAIWQFDRQVASGTESVATLRAERASLLKQLADFRQSQPELFPNVMDPEVENRRKFASVANMIFHDPSPVLNAIKAPLLETIGENDEVVDPATTLAALERLRASGHDVTTKTFPGVGHSLLKMDGTTILGYADGYLEYIVVWSSSVVSSQRPAK